MNISLRVLMWHIDINLVTVVMASLKRRPVLPSDPNTEMKKIKTKTFHDIRKCIYLYLRCRAWNDEREKMRSAMLQNDKHLMYIIFKLFWNLPLFHITNILRGNNLQTTIDWLFIVLKFKTENISPLADFTFTFDFKYDD